MKALLFTALLFPVILPATTAHGETIYSDSSMITKDRVADVNVIQDIALSVTPTSSQQQIGIEWDQVVPVLNSSATSYGPYFGIAAYDDTAEFGSFGVDGTTDTFLLQQANTGYIWDTGTPAGTGWNHMQMTLNFSSNTYTVYANGTPLLSTPEGFIDGPSGSLTDLSIFATAAGDDAGSLAATGTAYFANLSVQLITPGTYGPGVWVLGQSLPPGTSLIVGAGATLIYDPSTDMAGAVAVPEPGTLLLLAVGCMTLAMVPLTVTRPLLSPRQDHIFYLLGAGMSTAEIAKDLGVAVKTAESHILALRKKIKVKGMAALKDAATEYFLSLEKE